MNESRWNDRNSHDHVAIAEQVRAHSELAADQTIVGQLEIREACARSCRFVLMSCAAFDRRWEHQIHGDVARVASSMQNPPATPTQ